METVEIDVGEMKPGDSIRVRDLPIADTEGVELSTDPDAVVVTVTEPHVSAESETEDSQTDSGE